VDKRLKFLLVPLMLATSIPVYADAGIDLTVAISKDKDNAVALFSAAIANTKDPEVIVALTTAVIKAAPEFAGQFTTTAIEAFPGSAEKIIQAAIAASPSSASDILKALVHDYEVNPNQIIHVPGVALDKSEANVNLTETVKEVIIESLKEGKITKAQADTYANDAFGPNSEAAKQIIIQECKVVSCN